MGIYCYEKSTEIVVVIRIAIIEDNKAYNAALLALLAQHSDMEVVYAASNLKDFTQAMLKTVPDVVIMDIDLSGDSGVNGVSILKSVLPEVSVFMLTVFEDEEKIFASVKAGAVGYILKKDPPEKIIDAIRRIYKGESVINGTIARKMLQYFSKPQHVSGFDPEEYNLTARETEVLHLLREGLAYKEIARQLSISVDTLTTHIKKVYSKLKVHSKAEIMAKFR